MEISEAMAREVARHHVGDEATAVALNVIEIANCSLGVAVQLLQVECPALTALLAN